MIRRFKTLILMVANIVGYFIFRRKFFSLKKERMFEDFYEKQIAQHLNKPPIFEGHYGRSRDYLMEVFKAMESGSSVLELGCYLSKRLNWFAERNPDLFFIGVDFSLKTLVIAKENCNLMPNLKLVAGDFNKLPFKSHKIDLIFSHLALYHIPYAQIRKAFGEIRRISRNDIVIIEPFHKVQPLKHKIYLLASTDKYAHDYRSLKGNTDFDLRDIIPVFDESSNYHPITIFRFSKN
jgi:ubiquinone/menaquinone biosynthesis C-methylase UbiE